MERTPRPGLFGAVRIDLARLHATWMELAFPRQLDPGRIVGKWRPKTGPQRASYWGWAALGVPLVAVGYPLLLVGFAARFHAGRIGGVGARLGVAGVVALSLLVWGALSAVAHVRFSFNGFVAVLAASLVATVCAAFAVVFSRLGGRGTSVLFAYPAGVTALFLPPVVAALYSPELASVVFPNSYTLAVWLLDNVLAAFGISAFLRENFTLEGVAYVGMWFGIAVPAGWLLGLVVALADVVRPRGAG
ncbi:hypothetical protein [Halegenticoccus tardaugens]|uniref:hypothetical protein n=1 Tax=Halegenticoccus tardaugens TaxID=2071624 RepID=UPI00100AE5B1|nr:hypothetical protein [Halegenticoccus tardaugens]